MTSIIFASLAVIGLVISIKEARDLQGANEKVRHAQDTATEALEALEKLLVEKEIWINEHKKEEDHRNEEKQQLIESQQQSIQELNESMEKLVNDNNQLTRDHEEYKKEQEERIIESKRQEHEIDVAWIRLKDEHLNTKTELEEANQTLQNKVSNLESTLSYYREGRAGHYERSYRGLTSSSAVGINGQRIR